MDVIKSHVVLQICNSSHVPTLHLGVLP